METAPLKLLCNTINSYRQSVEVKTIQLVVKESFSEKYLCISDISLLVVNEMPTPASVFAVEAEYFPFPHLKLSSSTYIQLLIWYAFARHVAS